MKIKREKCTVCNGTGKALVSKSTVMPPCKPCKGTGIIETVEFDNTNLSNN